MNTGFTVCKVCDREFKLTKDRHYIAVAKTKTGLAAVSGGEQPSMFDAFDCPFCGCQKLVNVRERVHIAEEEKDV